MWDVSVVVHGDDFTALGNSAGLDKFEKGMTDTFECKLKGRLGTGANDAKEMRVLNRIVRITNDGLLYEADPRHAEMLVKAFKLEDAKAAVTPGVKSADAEGDPDKMDLEVAQEIKSIIAQLSPKTSPGKVSFNPNAEVYEIPPYRDIYGRHPRTFNFDKRGRKIDVEVPHVSDGVSQARSASPNARRTILEHTLCNGAAWEMPTVE